MKLLLYLLINSIELTSVQVLASLSEGLLFTYGDDVSWDKQPKHLVRVRDGVETVVSDEPRVEIFFIKHKSIPGSLDATPKQWRFVEKAARATVKIFKDDQTWAMYADVLTADVFNQIVLKIRRLATPILIPRLCKEEHSRQIQHVLRAVQCRTYANESCQPVGLCYDTPVPPEHSSACYHVSQNGESVQVYKDGPGLAADLVLYFTISECNDIANAVSCQKEPRYRRPVAGRIHVCYKYLDDYMQKPTLMPNILMHELIHIVLHPLSGCNYYDAASDDVQIDTYSIDKRRWVSAVGTYKREVRLVKMPNVLRLVRRHFNCPTLDGVEVDTTKDTPERINHDRLAFAHFEARLFPDSLLSPYYLEGNVVSKLEIALFVDSGWYVVNESLGRPLTVTRGKGCEFATMSCYEYMNKYKFNPVKIYPYCTAADKNKWMCSLDGRRASYCLGSYYNEDDIHDAYKLKDGFVGYNYFTYCPMIVPKTLEDSSPYCDFTENVDFRSIGSYGGSPFQSMCLRFPYLSVLSSKWHCPLSFHSSYVGVCVKFACRPNGILFEFAGRRFFCLATQGGRRFSHNTRSKPYGCFMKFEFCCPDFALCSKNTTYQFTKESLDMC